MATLVIGGAAAITTGKLFDHQEALIAGIACEALGLVSATYICWKSRFCRDESLEAASTAGYVRATDPEKTPGLAAAPKLAEDEEQRHERSTSTGGLSLAGIAVVVPPTASSSDPALDTRSVHSEDPDTQEKMNRAMGTALYPGRSQSAVSQV